jgi:PadR family transcriptional regulator PadR
MADFFSTQLKKGVLDLCVLAILEHEDGYAYDIARLLAEAIDMGEGTIYPLMRRLQADGLVETYLQESASGPPRKYYRITKAGRSSLLEQKQEWKLFATSVNRILGAHR